MRHIHEIASEIEQKWTPKVHPWARPYLDAMSTLYSVNDSYGCDDARSIINYFLSNATMWRGEDARRIKKELKDIINETPISRVR
jgi:hypothetical protein